MYIILRNYKNEAQIIKDVKNFNVSYDEDGVFIEVDNYAEVCAELEKNGFCPTMRGKIINCNPRSVSCFE